MLIPKRLLTFFLLAILFISARAQTTKPFTLFSPADQATVLLQGNRSDLFPFVWTSGKGPQTAGVSYDYGLIFFMPNDTNTPLDIISKICCASSFADSVLNFSGDQWEGVLNGISQQLKGRDFMIGDTIDLLWRVNLSAISFGPTYEFRQSNYFSVRFIRGQFNDEYTPVLHKTPSDFQQFTMQGNPNQQVAFSWTSAYCPAGCGPAAYELLIDTVDGDFLYPYLSIAVPNNDSAWSLSYSTLNQLLEDTKTPHGSSRQVFWRVFYYGNSQVAYSQPRGEFTLWNGLLDNENKPFNLVNPSNNFVIQLSGLPSTQLNFKWELTYTPGGTPNPYYVVFDTAGASPLFSNPLMQFVSGGSGMDTAVNLTYGQLDDKLDSLYPAWTQVNMIWGIKALINGTFYYPVSPFNIQFKSGVLNSISGAAGASLSFYPNPANDQIFVKAVDHTRKIALYTIQGQLVHALTLMPGEGRISLSDLPDGIYMLYLQDDQTTYSEKVVISH